MDNHDLTANTPEVETPDPDVTLAQVDPYDDWAAPSMAGVEVTLTRVGRGLRVDVGARAGVSRVVLRWKREVAVDAVVLGDAWERSYGDLEWRGHRPERPLPWSHLVQDRARGETWGAGVEVRGGAFAFWTVDPHGVSLWLDLRAGDGPVQLGDRVVHAATVRSVHSAARPYAVQCTLTSLLCTDPLLPDTPLVGANNYYYAYAKDFDAAAVLRDARTIADLVGDHPVRPFGVVDEGWNQGGAADGRVVAAGPWDRPRRPHFEDMTEFAAELRATGVRPGLWYRPLVLEAPPADGFLTPRDDAFVLDPSHPATLDRVTTDIGRFVAWGFDLIKHDFSTYDVFGRWGSAMGPSITGRPWLPASTPSPPRGWAPADPTLTNAETLVRFYRTIRDASGDAVLLGCNVVGHLAAGLTHAQRIGDDTSGLVWERTRRVGINTLAFRLAQHARFFAVDADCVPSTTVTDWSKNRQFLDLIARSGTALFVSVDPRTRTPQIDADLSAALRLALDGGVPGGVEPLDWLHTATPERWRSGDQQISYDWLAEQGADPFEWAEFNR
ncbi:MAG TPA: hypothetical protein VIT20_04265 [Propionibacteriaceae bacterium]